MANTKIMAVMLMLLMAVSVMPGVLAQGSDTAGSGTGSEQDSGTNAPAETPNSGEDSQSPAQIQTRTETNNPSTGEIVRTQEQAMVQTGSYTTENGNQVQVQTQTNNRIQLKAGEATADTAMQMTQQQTQTGTKLQVKLSNGQNAEVKVMPDTAAIKAMEQLRLKSCTAEEGCSIELKEVGQGEQMKAAYEIKTNKQMKVLGLFRAQMNVQAQVDAENGEVIQTKKQWWAFLATDAEE